MREHAERIAILEQRDRANGSGVDEEAFRDYAPLTAADTAPTSIRLWRNPPASISHRHGPSTSHA
ncbi:hypothetical protein ACFYU5_08645 [Nocardia aobensis]|uniref:Uncharacterized protein n=1 Tax=Nocardia aobensis TaxID=257277 RepID=A0ABW6NZ51_9NOCA